MAAELWQRRKKRRRMGLLAGAAAVIAAAVAVGGIFAYYTSHQQMTNTFTVGQNTTTIEEEFDPNPVNDVYKKAVQIANKGDVPCYVRVYVAFSDEEVADISQLSALAVISASNAKQQINAAKNRHTSFFITTHIPFKCIYRTYIMCHYLKINQRKQSLFLKKLKYHIPLDAIIIPTNIKKAPIIRKASAPKETLPFISCGK